MTTDTTPQPGGTVQHDGFEVTSNTETPEEMREVLGVEPEEEEASKAAALLGKKGGEATAKRKLAPIPDRKPADDAADGSTEKPAKEAKPDDKLEKPEAKEAKPDESEDEDAPAGETKEQKAERKRLAAENSARAKERVETIARDRAELRRQLAERDRELETLRQKVAPQPKELTEPRLEDYEEPEKYLAALRAYDRQQWERESEAKRQQETTIETFRTQTATLKAAVDKMGGSKFLASLDPVVANLEPTLAVRAYGGKITALNALADEFLKAGENGPRLMQYFSEHPEHVDRLSKLDVFSFMREMGKVEKALEYATADETTSSADVSRARKPVRSVTGAPPSVGDDEDEADEPDFDKFMARRKSARR